MHSRWRWPLSVLLLACLTACGGGGGGSNERMDPGPAPDPETPFDPQGATPPGAFDAISYLAGTPAMDCGVGDTTPWPDLDNCIELALEQNTPFYAYDSYTGIDSAIGSFVAYTGERLFWLGTDSFAPPPADRIAFDLGLCGSFDFQTRTDPTNGERRLPISCDDWQSLLERGTPWRPGLLDDAVAAREEPTEIAPFILDAARLIAGGDASACGQVIDQDQSDSEWLPLESCVEDALLSESPFIAARVFGGSDSIGYEAVVASGKRVFILYQAAKLLGGPPFFLPDEIAFELYECVDPTYSGTRYDNTGRRIFPITCDFKLKLIDVGTRWRPELLFLL